MRERYSGVVAGGDFGAGDFGDGDDDEMYDAPWHAVPGVVAVLAASRTDALEAQGLQVAATDLDGALEELLSTRNTMTRVLLGVSKTRSDSGR